MELATDRAYFRSVTDERTDRARRLINRMDALRISARQFEERTQISRRTLQRAIDAEPSVKASTYDHIESWLDRLERQAKGFEGIPGAGEEPEDAERFVEIEVRSVEGLRVVVRGPVADRAEVEKSAIRLMRELGAERKRDGK